jgi:hypothetical protein
MCCYTVGKGICCPYLGFHAGIPFDGLNRCDRPRAMISDFGTSEEMLHRKRDRTGHTGTME